MKNGFSIVELFVALLVIGVLVTLAAPALRGGLDALAASGARDAFAALVSRARVEAVRAGGARVVLETGPGVAVVETAAAAAVTDSLRISTTWGVSVAVDGAAAGATVALDFDAFGVGRLANRTIRFRRGAAESRLSLSIYGRARRW